MIFHWNKKSQDDTLRPRLVTLRASLSLWEPGILQSPCSGILVLTKLSHPLPSPTPWGILSVSYISSEQHQLFRYHISVLSHSSPTLDVDERFLASKSTLI